MIIRLYCMRKIKYIISVLVIAACIMSPCTGMDVSTVLAEEAVDIQNPWVVEEDGCQYICYNIVNFGSYPQSDVTGDTSDPIKWRVMSVEDDRVLLWADSILDYQKFDVSASDSRCWDESDIRKWLMEDFFETAFDFSEQMSVKSVDHTVVYPEGDRTEVVRDTVFIPEMNELYSMIYSGTDRRYLIAEREMAYWRYATAYAHLKLCKSGASDTIKTGYWLRDAGSQKGIYNYVLLDYNGNDGKTAVYWNSSIDTARYMFGICPMVYVSRDALIRENDTIETLKVVPSDTYDPPYKDVAWVADNLEKPRLETDAVVGHKVIYDIVEMGKYPQTDETAKTKDPIKWRVMDVTETKVMLMADSIIDYIPYNDSEERNGIYWGASDIREWLNDNFYNVAFSDDERKDILYTEHENGSKMISSVYTGKTTDKIMLPSYDDSYNWMNGFDGVLTDLEKEAVIFRFPTAYSYRQRRIKSGSDDDGFCYWLGTSSDQDGYYMIVAEEELEGKATAYYSHIQGGSDYIGVCPVMWVNRSDTGIYNKTEEISVTIMDEVELPFSRDTENAGNNDEPGDGTEPGSEAGEPGDGTEPGSEAGEPGDQTEPGSEAGEPGDGTEPGSEAGESGDGTEPGSEAGEPGDGTEPGSEAGEPGDKQGTKSGENSQTGKGEDISKLPGLEEDNTAKSVTVEGSSGKITKDIRNAVVGDFTEQIYIGEELCPEITLIYDGRQLLQGIDYTVSYSNNINSGIAYANVTGRGDYSGTVGYAFAVQPRVIDGLNTILKGKDGSIYKAVYTGEGIRPKTTFRLPITVKGVQQRLSPQEGKDYTVSYSNNRKIGVATITYRFYGNYNGIVTKDFQIVPAKVTGLSAKKKGKGVQLTWKKVKGASGYEISASSKKNGKYKRIARIGKKCKYKVKKAKSKKYYKVRAFGKQGGIRYYGDAALAKIK